jgi:hypothetical protein
MKSFSFKTVSLLIVIILGWQLFKCARAQDKVLGETREKISAINSGVPSSSETNGIAIGVGVGAGFDAGRTPEVFVSYDQTASVFPGTNSLYPYWANVVKQHVEKEDWIYFKATNLFCGPIELRDASGEKIAMRKPEVSMLTAYPASYGLQVTASNYYKQFKGYSGPFFPEPLMRPASVLIAFHLQDYFKLIEPGNYKLTVWPKIYKRSATNDDLCERVDIPPVTVFIKWGEVNSTRQP